MIWLNPWAWAGVSGVVLPVLIHLLGRGHARVHRFPTLRFLDASRLLPTRRTRIHDALLLGVRGSVIVLAAAALANPLLLTAERRQSLDRGLARAIIVDTSASMRRATSSGILAVDSARHRARALAAAAQTSVIVESNDPSRALRGAAAWLIAQGRRAELILLSDFQRGQVDSSAFAVVPRTVGLLLIRVPVVMPSAIESSANIGDSRIVARSTLIGERTDAEWKVAAAASRSDAVSLLGTEADSATLRATTDAAATLATPLPIDSTRAIAIVFPKYKGHVALESSVRRVTAPWMVDLLARVRADSLRVGASGIATVAGRQRLVLFTESEPGSLASARLVAAANRATSVAPRVNELEPDTLSDAALAALQRPASDSVRSQLHPTDANGPSDARWLWLGVLALLLAETVLRRRAAAAGYGRSAERAGELVIK